MIDGEDEEASVVKFVNQIIIREALAQKATDIHVDSRQPGIRYRIDGFYEVPVPENIKQLQASVTPASSDEQIGHRREAPAAGWPHSSEGRWAFHRCARRLHSKR
ncbi:MAG: hypothetical protein R3F13_06435 [Prosthecobacter sp.]